MPAEEIKCIAKILETVTQLKTFLICALCLDQKKTSPFNICYNLTRCHPILSIRGRIAYPRKFETNTSYAQLYHISFYMFVLYLVKLATSFTAYSRPTATSNMKSPHKTPIHCHLRYAL